MKGFPERIVKDKSGEDTTNNNSNNLYRAPHNSNNNKDNKGIFKYKWHLINPIKINCVGFFKSVFFQSVQANYIRG